jgi:hypothetical protein
LSCKLINPATFWLEASSKRTFTSTKEGLFAALVQRLAREKVHFTVLDEEPAVALRFVATTVLDQVTQEPEYLNLVRLVIAESGRFPQLAQTFVRNLAKSAIDRLTQYLASSSRVKIARCGGNGADFYWIAGIFPVNAADDARQRYYPNGARSID